jgi:predicted nucleic acid-binding protein
MTWKVQAMIRLVDSSVFIPYLLGRYYVALVDSWILARRLLLCSVVVEEITAGARDQEERRRYDAFFAEFRRQGLIITPTHEEWQTCGRLLSRYRQRFGAIEPRDHQNDVLILLTAIRASRDEETILVTENDSDFRTWLRLTNDRTSVRIAALRRQ